MSDKSAKPILVAGAVGTVALLGVAWMFAASTSNQAIMNAQEYAEAREPVSFSAAAGAEEVAEGADTEEVTEVEEPAEEVAEADSEPETEEVAEEEVAEAEAEEPVEEEVAEADVEESAEPEVAEAEAEEPADTEVAEAEPEEPAETEASEAEAEEPAESEVAEAEAEEPAETEVAEAKAGEPAEAEVAEAAPAAAVATAALTGDAKAGAKVFRKCKACHQIGDGAKNRVGPMLTDIVGRTMGSVEGFKYSDAFVEANEAGRVWTSEELAAFLAKPKEYMKGTKMAFGGLRKEDDRDDVIAFLASNGE